MAEGKLSKDIKIFIVQQLATWELPSVIRVQVKELFDVDITLPAINYYLPQNASKKWKEVFDNAREKFLKETAEIPIANKAFRLRELDSLYRSQKISVLKNPVEMRAALEQAAKESGNQFTNRTEHTGKGGSPLIPENAAQVVVYIPDNGRGDGPTPVVDPRGGTNAENPKS